MDQGQPSKNHTDDLRWGRETGRERNEERGRGGEGGRGGEKERGRGRGSRNSTSTVVAKATPPAQAVSDAPGRASLNTEGAIENKENK